MLSKEELKQFSKLPTGNVCDANGKRGNMEASIKPIDKTSTLTGPAVTVRCPPGDNLTIHQAIYCAEPGSVLVIDAHGYTGAGPIGEIVVIACQERGIAGIVINGTCRDSLEIEKLNFPFFCKGFNPGGTVKKSLGAINETIECAGCVVHPGDIIVGDADGIVVIQKEKAREVLQKAQAIADKEVKIIEMLRSGKTTLEIYGFDKIIEQEGGNKK